jgi:hypothetical protein
VCSLKDFWDRNPVAMATPNPTGNFCFGPGASEWLISTANRAAAGTDNLQESMKWRHFLYSDGCRMTVFPITWRHVIAALRFGICNQLGLFSYLALSLLWVFPISLNKGEKMLYNRCVSKKTYQNGRKTCRGKQKKIRFERGNTRVPQILHFFCHERNVQLFCIKVGKCKIVD